ncbi:histidine kinase [Persicitalea jodogahamensis]|uniref:Histidine kinase n=1 Tax=Persicitalea jodogahamensis TaxID=402147 RepID=A0A8J3D7I2_9BACT|nr:histidine kinase [Persicitalea jodogahamensis]
MLVFALIFYLHFYLFIPKLFFRRQFLAYGLVFGAGLLLVSWQQPFDRLIMRHESTDRPFGPPPGLNERPERFDRSDRPAPPPTRRDSGRESLLDIVSIMLYLMIWAIGLAIAIAQRSRQSEQRATQAEADKARAELSSLKAQINPHFLFNTLNTIYTLARLNHPACTESIMKLSNIMRYVSDEVREDFVLLEDEVACLRHYIELQELRLSKKTTVKFETSGDLAHQQIPPLILMTLVENIFKHGVSNREASVIEIKVVAETGKVLFYSKNRIFQNTPESGRTGIGLDNVRKRLEHIYPDRHLLRIDDDERFFIVNLEVNT